MTERVLPTGTTHVVWRQAQTPLTLLNDGASSPTILSSSVLVGGIRSAAYDKRVVEDAATVGIQLKPGGAWVLLGVPADELAERHTSLESVWGRDATHVLERIYAEDERLHPCSELSQRDRDPAMLRERLNVLEEALLARVRHLDVNQPRQRWIEHCVRRLEHRVPLAQLVNETGVSHRTFITRFRSAVGLSPKVYTRVRRFQLLIQALGKPLEIDGSSGLRRPPSFAQLAVDAGYSDQAHLCRDFQEFTRLSPTEYVRLAPLLPNHVRLRP